MRRTEAPLPKRLSSSRFPQDVPDTLSIAKELSQFQEQQRLLSTNLKYKGLLFPTWRRQGAAQPMIGWGSSPLSKWLVPSENLHQEEQEYSNPAGWSG
jgi:hypothetical protein